LDGLEQMKKKKRNLQHINLRLEEDLVEKLDTVSAAFMKNGAVEMTRSEIIRKAARYYVNVCAKNLIKDAKYMHNAAYEVGDNK
jgi:metal-responsive CopG/Arc/MetJ family transcriptional regulator